MNRRYLHPQNMMCLKVQTNEARHQITCKATYLLFNIDYVTSIIFICGGLYYLSSQLCADEIQFYIMK